MDKCIYSRCLILIVFVSVCKRGGARCNEVVYVGSAIGGS